jgi:hypothetical protein
VASSTPGPAMVMVGHSPGVFDPERFYFVRTIVGASIAMWGAGIWLALVWLRIHLERVPRPKGV